MAYMTDFLSSIQWFTKYRIARKEIEEKEKNLKWRQERNMRLIGIDRE